MKKFFWFFFAALMIMGSFGKPAQAAPVRAPLTGEIERLTLNNPADPWSGGTMQVDGGVVIIPKNLLIDLPANRLTLTQIFAQAPPACVAAGESGLAKADTCNTSGVGGFATISANKTNNDNVIAGDVFIQKGIESVTGPVTYINYTDGYFRINGNALNATQVDDNTGVMVRLNDPTGRHTVQQGLGCLPGSLNCSPDPRFTLDPDNYTNVFTSGYPLCLPSTVSRTFVDVLGLGTTTAQSAPDGTGDVLCPTTNRTVNLGAPVDDSRRFAPIMLGDSITAEGNLESINCVRFISSHTLMVNRALSTKIADPTQPDYMFLDEVGIDMAGFQNLRVRTLIIGFTTEADTDVMVWSLHRDPTTNAAHEFPLATVVGCDAAGGAGTCGNQGIVGVSNIFKIRHDVDFLVGAGPRLDPCAHLNGDPRMGTGFCPGGSTLENMFGILSPIPHEIQARTGKKYRDGLLPTPLLITLDVKGSEATNGQYLFPLGLNLGGIVGPEFVEINLDALDTPISFTGIPWNLDRRLSPGGCNGPCEGTPQPLDPFPFEGLAMDPRTQATGLPTGAYNDTHFTSSQLTNVSNRILSYVSGGGTNFNGDTTVLAWPPVDPAHVAVPAGVPVAPRPSTVSITSAPVFNATQGLLYSYQVTATNASACGGLTYSLDLFPSPPAGIIIDPATGLIQWTPTSAQVGFHPVTVRATEPGGAFDTQPFGIDVAGVGPIVLRPADNDFDGDGKTDITVWRGTTGTWLTLRSSDRGVTAQQWGGAGDIAATGDYDGDGKTDMAVWRPSDGNWYILRSSDGTVTATQWGTGTLFANPDKPVPGDYDGDGKTDLAVWRPGDGNWFVLRSSDGTVAFQQWGALNDKPVPGDYDGDGRTDYGVWRPTDGNWYIVNSLSGTVTVKSWGGNGDIPVPGDFDGDGKTDYGVWRPTDGNWYIVRSTDGSVTATQLGTSTDIPIPGDYDGDGKTDLAVYRPGTGEWFIIPTGIGVPVVIQWGGDPSDVPITTVIP